MNFYKRIDTKKTLSERVILFTGGKWNGVPFFRFLVPLFLFKVGWNLAVGCAIINTIVEIVEKRVEDTNEARREE